MSASACETPRIYFRLYEIFVPLMCFVVKCFDSLPGKIAYYILALAKAFHERTSRIGEYAHQRVVNHQFCLV